MTREELNLWLEKEISSYPCKTALHMTDADTGEVLHSFNADTVVTSASTIKTPVLLAALDLLAGLGERQHADGDDHERHDDQLEQEELAGERFVTISEKNARHSYGHWLRARREDGIPVTDLLKVETTQAQAAMVEMNEAVAVLPLLRDLTRFNSFKCAPVRIEGIRERVRYVIAYRESLKDDPNLQKFVEVTKLVYGRERTIIS